MLATLLIIVASIAAGMIVSHVHPGWASHHTVRSAKLLVQNGRMPSTGVWAFTR
jgi:hypothetical protein